MSDALAVDPVNGNRAAPVIDLREAETTHVRIEREDNPFAALAKPERMRLIVLVLCELVAYGELSDDPGLAS